MASMIKSYIAFIRSEQKLAKLYIGSLIRTIGRSLIRLFLPIYLLDLGFTLPQIIIYYYIVKSAMWALSTIPAEWISRRWSPDHSIIVGTFFSIANYLLISSTKSSEISFLVIIGTLSGAAGGLYWLGYHLDFSANSSKDSRGQSLALMRTTTILANAMGPLIGGLISQWVGFQYMMTMSMFLLILSLVPMLPKVFSKNTARSEHQQPNPNNDESSINIFLTILDISWIKTSDLLVLFTYGMEQCLGFNAWSIYTSMNFFDQKFELIGLNASLSVFCSLIITLLFGKLIDKNRATALYIGVVSNTTIWIARMFIRSRWQATLLDMLFSISHSLLGNSMFALSYDRALATHIYSYLIIQEMYLAFGQICVWLVCLYFPTLYPVFILGAVVSLFQVFATKNANLRKKNDQADQDLNQKINEQRDLESNDL